MGVLLKNSDELEGMKGTLVFLLLPLFYASLAEGFLVRKGARQQLHHHLRCWAINGWSGDDDKDEWCTNNCIHIPSYCPQDTGDGGGCDCNCDEGDEGCPLNGIPSFLFFIN